MREDPLDTEAVRRHLAAEGIPLEADRLPAMTEAVRAYRAMAAVLHEGLDAADEPAGLEVPAGRTADGT